MCELLAHCATQLAYIERRAPFLTAHPVDEAYSVDFSQVSFPGRDDGGRMHPLQPGRPASSRKSRARVPAWRKR
ncbi:MAG: hypothetical protein GEV05_09830 [Betaproteobacteria bacterium]|nr:hypothetical protein [Betaproteobacteria bacterium]